MATEPATTLTPGPAIPQPFSTGLQFSLSSDLLALLPSAADDKLRLLRQRFSDAHAIIPAFETIREASDAKQNADRALKRLTDDRSVGGFELGPDDGRVVDAQRTLDKATADFRRLEICRRCDQRHGRPHPLPATATQDGGKRTSQASPSPRRHFPFCWTGGHGTEP